MWNDDDKGKLKNGRKKKNMLNAKGKAVTHTHTYT